MLIVERKLVSSAGRKRSDTMSLADYLKKYESSGGGLDTSLGVASDYKVSKKKIKAKEKKKKPAAAVGGGLVVVDDDAVWQKIVKEEEEEEDDLVGIAPPCIRNQRIWLCRVGDSVASLDMP